VANDDFGPQAQTFAQGVVAGAAALEQLDQLAGYERDAKLKYFWLKVGTELAKAVPNGEQELVTLFVQGASTRQPNEEELQR